MQHPSEIYNTLLGSNTMWEFFVTWRSLNMGSICGDQVEHVSQQAQNLMVPESVAYVIILCGTNKIMFQRIGLKTYQIALFLLGHYFMKDFFT